MKKVWSRKTNGISGNVSKQLPPEVMRRAYPRRAVGATSGTTARRQTGLWIFDKFDITVPITV